MSTATASRSEIPSMETIATTVRVATQGDDLGTNHSANLAFHEAFTKGLLRNASLMPSTPCFEEAAQMLAHEKGLCCGLHSCINAEWDTYRWGPVSPVEKVRSLVRDDGTFCQTTVETFKRDFSVDEIFVELQAQLNRARALGFDISYVDAHMGWTWILEKRGQMDRFRRWAESENLLFHVKYSPLPDADTSGDPVERLISRIAKAAPGYYRYGGHPAYDNEEMRPLGHPGYESPKVSRDREWERLVFTDPRIVRFFAERGIEAIRHDFKR